MALNNFKEVQAFITAVMDANKTPGTPPPNSPHKAFWLSMTYEEFVNGNVPHVLDPSTGEPLKILQIGNAAASNLIMALRGEGPLFSPGTGAFGRMPANDRMAFTDEQIGFIAAWIDAGCPE